MRSTRTLAFLLITATICVAPAAAKPKYGTWGVDYATMDRTTKPGDDFFAYAEGTWLKTYPIPADKSSAGYNAELPDISEREVRAIVEAAQKQPSNDPMVRQIVDFYTAWMDEAGIEARGLKPLQPYLARITSVSTRAQLNKLMAEPGFASPIDIGVAPDDKDPTHYTINAGQARLGLPTRDYYLLPGAKYDSIRQKYRDYIVHILTLAGVGDAVAKADRIIALETKLSQDQWTPERRRDPQAT